MITVHRLSLSLFGVLIFALALGSVGFLHPDEHYQVIEYMNVFLGRFSHDILSTLEWKAMMRPWFQPIVFAGPIALVRDLAGGPLPFFEASLLRLFSVLLGLLWLIPLIKRSLPYFFRTTACTWWRGLLICSFIAPWFVTFLSVRTSSDTVGAHLFMIALVSLGLPFELKDQSSKKLALFSVLCGIAILVRYQMVVWIGPTYLFFLFKSRWPRAQVLSAGVASLCIASSEILFNYWGRGLWYSSTVNHINLNLFHGVAATFGTLPWWGYFKIFFKEGLPPLCLFYFYICARHLVKGRGGLIAIITLISFVFFSLIAHKEARFLTPTLFLLSLMLAGIGGALKPRLVLVLGGLNLLLTVGLIFKPAYRPILIYRALDEIYRPGDTIYVLKDRKGRELSFELHHYQRHPWQVASYQGDQTQGLVVSSTYAQYELLLARGCALFELSYPVWVLSNNSFGWRERSNIWGVWRCK